MGWDLQQNKNIYKKKEETKIKQELTISYQKNKHKWR